MATTLAALSLGDVTVRQLDGLFSLNDLHRASGGSAGQRPGYFLGIDQTKALVAEIETAGIPAVSTREGRNGGTYACRELVIAYAAWISAAFHLRVIRVFLGATAPASQSAPYSVAVGQTLSAEQADMLRALLNDHASKLPKDAQAGFVIKGWSKLKAHFKVNYRLIPAPQFCDAVSLLARHCVEHGTQQALPAPGAATAASLRRWLMVSIDGQPPTFTPLADDVRIISPAELAEQAHQERIAELRKTLASHEHEAQSHRNSMWVYEKFDRPGHRTKWLAHIARAAQYDWYAEDVRDKLRELGAQVDAPQSGAVLEAAKPKTATVTQGA